MLVSTNYGKLLDPHIRHTFEYQPTCWALIWPLDTRQSLDELIGRTRQLREVGFLLGLAVRCLETCPFLEEQNQAYCRSDYGRVPG